MVIGTVLVAPSYIDWNRYRGAIEAYAEEVTGRDVTIEGDIRFVLLPVPELSLGKFSIANELADHRPEDARTEDPPRKMISLERLELRAALKPLLSGRVELTDVRLIRPLIAVEILAGNHTNWQFDRKDQKQVRASRTERPWWLSALLRAVRLDRMTVEDGTLTYSDRALQVSDVVRNLNGEFTATTLNGPFTAIGRANFRGVDIRFDASVGDTSRVRAVPAKLTVTLLPSEAKVTFRGFLEQATLFGPVSGRLSFTSAEAGAGWHDLVSLLRGEPVAKPKGRLAKILAQDLTFETALAIADRQVTASDVILGLGGVRAKGEITGRIGRAPHFTASLSARSVNLDSLLQEEAQKQRSVNMKKAATTIEKELTGFLLPQSLSGRINIEIDGVIYRAGVIQNLKVEAFAEKGHIKVKKATGRLPGKTAFLSTGDWSPVAGGLRYDGRIEVTAENPRALFAWLGFPVAEVPSARLSDFGLTAEVITAPDRLTLSALKLVVDGKAHEGAFSYVRAPAMKSSDTEGRPRFDLEVVSDDLDLDAYAPLLPAVWREGAPSFVAGRMMPLPWPSDGNGSLKARLGRLHWQGKVYRAVDVAVEAQDDVLAVKQFRVADYDGARVEVTGTFGRHGQVPVFSIDAAVDAAAPAPVLRLFGVSFPAALEQAGATSLRLSGTLGAKTGRIDMKARIAQGGGEEESNEVVLSGRLVRREGALALTLSSTGPDGSRIEVNGEQDAEGRTSLLEVSVRAPDLPAFASVYGVAYQVAEGRAGPFDLSASLATDHETVVLKALDVNIGPARASLQGTLSRAGERSGCEGQAVLTAVDVDALMPVAAPVVVAANLSRAADIEALEAQLAAQPAPAAAEWLRGYDCTIHLQPSSFSMGRYDFQDVTGTLSLQDGVLSLTDLSASLFGGTVSGRVSYRAADLLPELEGELQLKAAELKPALAAFLHLPPASQPLTGSADLDFSFSALGRGRAALVSTLNGPLKLAAADGMITGIDIRALKKALSTATSLDVFRTLAAKAMSSGRTGFQTLYGEIVVEDGRVLLDKGEEPLTIVTEPETRGDVEGMATLSLSGDVDLTTRLIAGEAAVKLTRADEAAPPLVLRLTGPLSAPRRQIEAAALGAFYVDDFAKRADHVTGTETDRKIELFRNAIETLDAGN